MSKQSIIGLHAEITANAAQLVNEYARADQESRRRNASIRAELSKTISHLEREFSAAKIGKGVLHGLGLGSGAAIATAAIEKIGEAMSASKERAKELSEYIEKMRDDLKEIGEMRFNTFIAGLTNDADKAKELQRHINELNKKKEAAASDRDRAKATIADLGMNRLNEDATTRFKPDNIPLWEVGWNMISLQWGKLNVMGMIGDKATAEMEKKQKEVEDIEKKVDELGRRRDDAIKNQREKGMSALVQSLKTFNDKIESENKRAIGLAEKLRDAIATPSEKLAKTISETADLVNRGYLKLPGGITKTEGDRMIAKANKQFAEDTDPLKNSLFQKWEKLATGYRIDDMTRRGLGSGANYAELSKQNTSVLIEIRDLIRRALTMGVQPSFAY